MEAQGAAPATAATTAEVGPHGPKLSLEELSLSKKESSNGFLEPPTISCKYCDVKFSSWQALGGHQNAHKHEHALAKQARRARSAGLRGPCGVETRGPIGLCGLCMQPARVNCLVCGGPLGVRISPMIHKAYLRKRRCQSPAMNRRPASGAGTAGNGTGIRSDELAADHLNVGQEELEQLDLTLKL